MNGQTDHKPHHPGKWTVFLAMIATSIATMFVLKYSNVWAIDHVFFSQTRLWMALMMGMAMVIIMLAFMWGMYGPRRLKVLVMAGAIAGFALFLFLARSQSTVDDKAWMKAMIPHHSIAVLTSERASISDPRVRKLADSIIEAQVKEIAEMKLLLADIDKNGEMGDGTPIPARSARLTEKLYDQAAEEVERPLTEEGRNDIAEMR
jgi:signal transduction histidine kinase